MSFWNSGYHDLIDSISWGFLACNFSYRLAQEKTCMCHLPYVVCANQFLDLSCYKYLDSKIMWCPCKWTVDISSHCTCLCQTSTSAQAWCCCISLGLFLCTKVSLVAFFLLLDLSCLYVTTGVSWDDVWKSCASLDSAFYNILSYQKCNFSPGYLLAFT